MSWDAQMYDEDQNFAMKAHTTSINEELGQIEYIFSDKTGTLTCNIMEFKKFSTTVGAFVIPDDSDQGMANKAPMTGMNMVEPVQPEDQLFKIARNNGNLAQSYLNQQRNSVERLNIDFQNYGNRDRTSTKKTHVSVSRSQNIAEANIEELRNIDEIVRNPEQPEHQPVEEVLMYLSLCHSVVIDKRTNKMNSASPDELALVEGAQSHGYSFEGKTGEGIISIRRTRDDQILQFQLMNTLEFNSTRKRMSVILKDLQTGDIELLCKGADSIIKPRLDLEDPEIADYM